MEFLPCLFLGAVRILSVNTTETSMLMNKNNKLKYYYRYIESRVRHAFHCIGQSVLTKNAANEDSTLTERHFKWHLHLELQISEIHFLIPIQG